MRVGGRPTSQSFSRGHCWLGTWSDDQRRRSSFVRPSVHPSTVSSPSVQSPVRLQSPPPADIRQRTVNGYMPAAFPSHSVTGPRAGQDVSNNSNRLAEHDKLRPARSLYWRSLSGVIFSPLSRLRVTHPENWSTMRTSLTFVDGTFCHR